MRISIALQKLRAGQVVRVCSTGSYLPYFPHMAAHFGYDAVWVDAEHAAWNAREIAAMIAQHHLADIDCVWRTGTLEKAGLSRLLEDGATALMIPQVNTPQGAEHLVASTKYPPLGDRGLDGAGLDAGFWVNKPADYPQRANRETFLVVQIETPLAVENVDSIVAVEGVDVLFLGPGDLSLRLGCAPSLKEPKLAAALETMVAACKKHRKPWGLPVGSIEDARTIVEMGGQFLVYGSEFMSVYKQLENCQSQLDSLLGKVPARPATKR